MLYRWRQQCAQKLEKERWRCKGLLHVALDLNDWQSWEWTTGVLICTESLKTSGKSENARRVPQNEPKDFKCTEVTETNGEGSSERTIRNCYWYLKMCFLFSFSYFSISTKITQLFIYYMKSLFLFKMCYLLFSSHFSILYKTCKNHSDMDRYCYL